MSLLFCKECSNMLYPTEKRAEKKLYYACRNCDASEPATNPCVYVNEMKQKITAILNLSREITLDPTLPRTTDVTCEKCAHHEAVFFTPSDENMELLFVCTNIECTHNWVGAGTTEAAKKLVAERAAVAGVAAAGPAAAGQHTRGANTVMDVAGLPPLPPARGGAAPAAAAAPVAAAPARPAAAATSAFAQAAAAQAAQAAHSAAPAGGTASVSLSQAMLDDGDDNFSQAPAASQTV